jgi:hypothetical protein
MATRVSECRPRCNGDQKELAHSMMAADAALAGICDLRNCRLCAFISGFFLPAVRFPPDPRPESRWGPGAMSHEYHGWECAEVTLYGDAVFFGRPNLEAVPVALSGWINPLVLFYLLSCAVKRLRRTRSFIAGAIAVSCIAMWIQLAEDHVTLLRGHYLWIAGIALILSAPLVSRLGARNNYRTMRGSPPWLP